LPRAEFSGRSQRSFALPDWLARYGDVAARNRLVTFHQALANGCGTAGPGQRGSWTTTIVQHREYRTVEGGADRFAPTRVFRFSTLCALVDQAEIQDYKVRNRFLVAFRTQRPNRRLIT